VNSEKRYDYLIRLWGHFARRWEPIVLCVLVLLALAVWPVPQWMVRHEYWQWSAHPNEYAKLVDDYRRTLVQIIGGAFLLYGLYLTQRRTKATEETLEVTRETQVTDRFTKAITQLGATDSQGRKQIETRLGAIYSLERIAKDSPDDHWPVMEILTAYVRENAPWREPENDEDALVSQEIPLAKDIQAIMTVIGRRKREQDKGRLDLISVDLRRAQLTEVYLDGARLSGANLNSANFREADLSGADLSEADLSRANLWKVHLEGAFLLGAHVEEAFLIKASLSKANLSKANLNGANFREANLKGADLRETVGLTQRQIDAALGDSTTVLPPGITRPKTWVE
jgi:hypothetical protein